ncbi:MAG: type VI secretion system tip protein TssI/VgrG [Alphaproteobacteria bacterium]|nr:type VI secretion system tip protein TssI/VgrG [Alphaproteobacteria bacterium]
MNQRSLTIDPENLDTSVKAPGGAPFVLRSLQGVEAFSSLYTFDVELFLMTEADSSAPNYDLSGGLYAPISIGIQRDNQWRYWNGIVTEFAQSDTIGAHTDTHAEEMTFFKIAMRPKLWLLTLRTNCRIFQNVTTADIVAEILQEQEIECEDRTSAPGRMRAYCVQYNETDFDFISRLMEEDGMYYFFDHEEEKHTMVICDKGSSFGDAPDPIFYTPGPGKVRLWGEKLEERHHIVPDAHTSNDYFYENPNTSLVAGDPAVPPFNVYEYPGNYTKQGDGSDIANTQQEAVMAQQTVYKLRVNSPFVRVGYYISFEEFERSSLNEGSFVVMHQEYNIHYEDDLEKKYSPVSSAKEVSYESHLSFFEASVPFVPKRVTPKPRIYGVQTAIVTGPEGEEIFTDELGRVHVKFHWDLSDTENEDTTCWVRVAQGWAGVNWGIVFMPRIGHEVVVSFVNGNPDYPLITGSVYNQVNLPAYTGDEPTRSGIRTASSLDADAEGDKFNELSFNDLSGEEQIFVHAQKDYDTIVHRGSQTTTIEAAGDDEGDCDLLMNRGSRTELLKEGDDSLTLEKGNRTALLQEGDDSLTLEKGNWLITLNEGNNEITLAKGDMVVSITGNQSTEVSEDYTLDVEGNVAINVKGSTSIKSDGAIDIVSQKDVTIEGMNITVKGQMNIEQEAGMEMKLSAMQFECEAQMQLDLKSQMMMNIESTLMLDVKGMKTSVKADTMLEVEGSAMFKASGGMIMIG